MAKVIDLVPLWVYHLRRTWHCGEFFPFFRTLIFFLLLSHTVSAMTLPVRLILNPWTTLRPPLFLHRLTKPTCFPPGGRGLLKKMPPGRSSYSRCLSCLPRSYPSLSFSCYGGGGGSVRWRKMWRGSWRKGNVPNRTSNLRRNIGPNQNYGRGHPRGGEKMSDSLRGDDGMPGCPAHRFTYRTIRSSGCLTPYHRPIPLLVQDLRRSHHPALRPRHRPSRTLVRSIPHRPELMNDHGIFVSGFHHHLRLPHLDLLPTNADPTCRLTSHQLKVQLKHSFPRELPFRAPPFLTSIPFPPIYHLPRPSRAI